jgi:uncharacterized protein with HEPN domain
MSLHSDRPYLADMRDTARKVLRFMRDIDHEHFLANEEKQWVAIRGIEVIAEASTKVSSAFVAAHADWPWAQMRGMRNVLIHGYAEVDMEIVWNVLQHELPDLLEKLDRVLGGDGSA